MRSLDERAPPWTGACPPEYGDASWARSDEDLDRFELILHSVMSAADEGDPVAIRCVLDDARAALDAGLKSGGSPVVLRGVAKRLYYYAYFGELVGLDTAVEGEPACEILSTEDRRSERMSTLFSIELDAGSGRFSGDALAAAKEGVEDGDLCEERGG